MGAFEDFIARWKQQATANRQDTQDRFGYVPPTPYVEDPNLGTVRNLPGNISNLFQGFDPSLAAAPVDILGAIPGISDANAYLWGNRQGLSRSTPTASSVSPSPPVAPKTPEIKPPAGTSVGTSISRGGNVTEAPGSRRVSRDDVPLWAKPNFTPPQEISLDPAYAAADAETRQMLAQIQAMLAPPQKPLLQDLMERIGNGLIAYGARGDVGDIGIGLRQDLEAEKANRIQAAQLGLRLPEITRQGADRRQRVAETNVTNRNNATRLQEGAEYEYGRDVNVEGRRRFEGDRAFRANRADADRAYGLQAQSLARQEAATQRQEDLIRLQLAQGFGGPNAVRLLAERAYGAGSPEASAQVMTSTLSALRGITQDSRGVRALNQMLQGTGVRIKNKNDVQGITAAAQILSRDPRRLEAVAGVLGYGEAPQARLTR